MSPLVFSTLFVIALAVSAGLRTWLASRQIRHVAAHRAQVPPAFADRISLAAHQRGAAYTIARTRLGLVDDLVTTVLAVVLTLFGGLQWIQEGVVAIAGAHVLAGQIALVLLAALAGAVVGLPLSWYRHFRLERRFGFSRMTTRLFIADHARHLLLALVLGVPLLWAILALMANAGRWWWVYAWLVWAGFNLLVLYLYPTLIAPLFNRFEPMPEDARRDRIEHLLHRCGFAAQGLFVMDGSRRSAHGNAYFTGFGRAKRIVFFDTLLERLDDNELEAVLAHELGHFRLHHIVRRIGISFLVSALGLWLLAWLAGQPWFFQGLGLTPAPGYASGAALVLFFVALPPFLFPLAPLGSLMSRRDEFQADAYAASQTDGSALVSALVKLYQDNAATLTPDPVHSAFYDSHPPAAVRIGHLLALSPPATRAHSS